MQQSLYRKWRPQAFSELKGQDAIRDTLFYGLTHGQMSQAYLFCGPRGTGKTTTARLIAKLVNCNAETGDRPCNTCPICQTITDGSNLDIFELDAASNRGIDEIRQLRDTVRFAPTSAKYKVFIIDEVHMLTREAFNALLKTLEEPPAYVVFILATTESHKIPPTIISRCQRYDFRLATQETLAEHLLTVAKAEKINLTPEAAIFVARLGDGSFRDSLSLLEQVATSNQKEYSVEVIEQLFGYVPQDQLNACLVAILSGNIGQAHALIDAALARGADIRALSDQLLSLSRLAMESLALGQLQALSPELASVTERVGLNANVIWVESLLGAINQAKQSPIARLPLDIAITKFSVVSTRPAITKPVVEAALAPVSISASKPSPKEPVIQPVKEVASETVQVQEKSVPVAETVPVPVAVELPQQLSADDWDKILTRLKEDAPSLVTTLAHAKLLGIDSDVLKIAVRFKMHADMINQPTKRSKIEAILLEVLEVPMRIEAEVVKDLPQEEEIVDLASVFELEDEL